MTFGLYFKDLLERQLQKDNIHYPIHIKKFVNNWNYFIWNHLCSNDILLFTNIIYKEIFLFIFFKKNIDFNRIHQCFIFLNPK